MRIEESLQCLEHMRVAQVPGFGAAVVHDSVVAFSRSDEARILGVEKAFAVVLRILQAILEQLTALVDDLR